MKTQLVQKTGHGILYNEHEINRITLNGKINNVILKEKILENDRNVFYNVDVTIEGKMESVYEPTQQELKLLSKTNKYFRIETYDDYKKNTYPIMLSSNRLWVFNILHQIEECNKIVYHCDDFTLTIHPKWGDEKDLENLYCLLIIGEKHKDLYSLRELTGEHISLLQSIEKKTLEIIYEKYGVESKYIDSYFHYQPSTWHLHIHFCHIDCVDSDTRNKHDLNNVVQNLKLDPYYYRNTDLKIVV